MAINAKTHTKIQMVIRTGSRKTFPTPTWAHEKGTTLAAVRQLLGWCLWHGCFSCDCASGGRGDGALVAPQL